MGWRGRLEEQLREREEELAEVRRPPARAGSPKRVVRTARGGEAGRRDVVWWLAAGPGRAGRDMLLRRYYKAWRLVATGSVVPTRRLSR